MGHISFILISLMGNMMVNMVTIGAQTGIE